MPCTPSWEHACAPLLGTCFLPSLLLNSKCPNETCNWGSSEKLQRTLLLPLSTQLDSPSLPTSCLPKGYYLFWLQYILPVSLKILQKFFPVTPQGPMYRRRQGTCTWVRYPPPPPQQVQVHQNYLKVTAAKNADFQGQLKSLKS